MTRSVLIEIYEEQETEFLTFLCFSPLVWFSARGQLHQGGVRVCLCVCICVRALSSSDFKPDDETSSPSSAQL